jgi:hypothetical protein
VVIVVNFGDDVQRYAHEFAGFTVTPPPACPQCAASGHLIGHGSYPRTVAAPTDAIPIRVKRLLCTACRHTLSLLPTFSLPFRHYQTATIQTVLTLRLEAHAAWSAVHDRFAPADLPSQTTCREWVAAFTQASASYLSPLLRHLATWAARSTGAGQLIAAVPHLLGGLAAAGLPIADGSRRWLAALWQWGHGRELGRRNCGASSGVAFFFSSAMNR